MNIIKIPTSNFKAIGLIFSLAALLLVSAATCSQAEGYAVLTATDAAGSS